MVRKKRMKKSFLKSIPNRLGYTLIVILFIVLLGIGVYAWTPGQIPNPGHNLNMIGPPSPCTSGQVITYNGVNLVCSTPSATDTRFTISSNGLCYQSPAMCTTENRICSLTTSFTFTTDGLCLYKGEDDLIATCGQLCLGRGVACSGDIAGCTGGTNTYYTYKDDYCTGGSGTTTAFCLCESTSPYIQEVSIPAGTRCI